jgi:flagellin-like hook-associated protein FlgL
MYEGTPLGQNMERNIMPEVEQLRELFGRISNIGKVSGQHLFAGSGAKYGREGMKWMTNYFAEIEVGCSSTSVKQFFDGIEFVSLPVPLKSQPHSVSWTEIGNRMRAGIS